MSSLQNVKDGTFAAEKGFLASLVKFPCNAVPKKDRPPLRARSNSMSLVLIPEVVLETPHDLPHVSRLVAVEVAVVQEVADALRLLQIESEGTRNAILDVHRSLGRVFSIPPIDPLLELGGSPSTSEPWRDCEEDPLGVRFVTSAVGCGKFAKDLGLDEGEVEVEDVDEEVEQFVFGDFLPQHRGEQHVQLHGGVQQVVRDWHRRYEAQLLFAIPQRPVEVRMVAAQCC